MGGVFDVLAGVIVTAMIGAPAAVAHRYPEEYDRFSDAVAKYASLLVLIMFFASLGYSVGVEAQKQGVAFSMPEIGLWLWIIVLMLGGTLAYLHTLSRTVALWAKRKLDREKGNTE